jgi:hypothetical protein
MRSSRNTISATSPMTGMVERMRWRMKRGMGAGVLSFSLGRRCHAQHDG